MKTARKSSPSYFHCGLQSPFSLVRRDFRSMNIHSQIHSVASFSHLLSAFIDVIRPLLEVSWSGFGIQCHCTGREQNKLSLCEADAGRVFSRNASLMRERGLSKAHVK